MTAATATKKHALSEDEIERAIGVSSAALAVAGHQASEFGEDVTRRNLRGEITDAEAIALIAKNAVEHR